MQLKKKITFKSVMNFFGAYWRKWNTPKKSQEIVMKYASNVVPDPEFINDIDSNPDLDDVTKLVLIRTELVKLNSPKCLEKDEEGKSTCVSCGCSTPDKFYESDACKYGCYKEWKDDTNS